MIDDRTYLEQLDRALIQRGLDAARTAEVIGEISDHLAQSGERPQAAFGEPDQYAAALLAADDPEGDAGQHCEARTFRATAFDEVRLLADLGRDAWELTGVRLVGLDARRPVKPQAQTTWEYARRTAVRRGPVLAGMEAEGWTPCGDWLTFHYFKRPTGSPT